MGMLRARELLQRCGSDLTGRALLTQAGRVGVSFSVDELPSGLYLLRVQEERGATHSEQVVLQ